MARPARVVLNRQALADIDRRFAQGLENLAEAVLQVADPPDATPFGVGLVDQGGYISYVDGKRVGGTTTTKPKTLRVRGRGVVVGVGFGFPGKFQELGTEHHPPQPFLMPAVMRVVHSDNTVASELRRAMRTAR
jgi:hypothetical protein